MDYEERLKRLVKRLTPILKEAEILYLDILFDNTLTSFSNKIDQSVSSDAYKATDLVNKVNEHINKLNYSKPIQTEIPTNKLKIGETYLYVPNKKDTVDFYLQFNNTKVKIIDRKHDNTEKTYFKKEALFPDDKKKCIYFVEPVNNTAYTFYARAESLKPLNFDDMQVDQYYWYNPIKTKTKPGYWIHSGFKVKLLDKSGYRSSGYPSDSLENESDCIYLVVMGEQGNWKFRTTKESLKKTK